MRGGALVVLAVLEVACGAKRYTVCEADADCADSASGRVVCAAPAEETATGERTGRVVDKFCASVCTDVPKPGEHPHHAEHDSSARGCASGETCVKGAPRPGAADVSICVKEPLLVKYPFFSKRGLDFNRSALVTALLVALVCGFLGVYVVLKRIVFVSASLSQIASLGVAVAFSIPALAGDHSAVDRHHVHPLEMSLAFTILGAVLFSFVRGNRRLSRESVMGIAYIVASALVIILAQYMSQADHDIKEILFGNPIAIETEALEVLAASSAGVLVFHIYFFKMLVFTSFDPEMMGTLGLRPRLWDILLFATIGLVIAVASRAIGSMNVFAFMVIPPAAALLLSDRLKVVMVLSVGVALLGALGGHYLSWTYDLPPGPTMVVATTFALIPGLVRYAIRRGS